MAALRGQMTDPRTLGVAPPAVEMPASFLIDDSMFIHGAPDPSVEIARGPNIGAPPPSTPLVDHLAGEVAIVLGDKITTDHISPAGQYLKYRSNIPRYAQAAFVRVDPTFAQRAAANRDAGVHNVIVAGESYGQGSSREHAAICPLYLGVKAVITKSYERIHIANLVNFGIAPLRFADPADYARLAQGDKIEIPGLRAAIEAGGDLVLVNQTQGVEVPLTCALSARERAILLAGGLLGTAQA